MVVIERAGFDARPRQSVERGMPLPAVTDCIRRCIDTGGRATARPRDLRRGFAPAASSRHPCLIAASPLAPSPCHSPAAAPDANRDRNRPAPLPPSPRRRAHRLQGPTQQYARDKDRAGVWLRLWYDRRAHSVLPWSQIAHPKSPIANLSAICPQPIHICSSPTRWTQRDVTRLNVLAGLSRR